MADPLRGAGAGAVSARPQDHPQATSAPLLKKDDGKIDWARSAHEIYNRIRGFTPWPGAFTTFRVNTYHLVAQPVSNQISATPSLDPGTLRDAKAFWACPCNPGKLAALLGSC